MINLGIVGYGHWGKNYARIFSNFPNVNLVGLADSSPLRREVFQKEHSGVAVFSSYEDLIKSSGCDAIVVATPATSHYQVVKFALEEKLDVLVEKPFTLNVKEADDLIHIAQLNNSVLMVAHTFLFNSGVSYLKKIIDEGAVGDLYYIKARRTHMGLVREDVNALWDLAPHDISILLYLLNMMPESVQAIGRRVLSGKKDDAVFATLKFPGGLLANLHVSWIDSNKERVFEIVGSKARVVFDDLNVQEPIKIYYKGLSADHQVKSIHNDEKEVSYGEFKYLLRDGDVLSPKIDMSEPLRNLCSEFISSLKSRKVPYSDGNFAKNITSILVQIDECLGV